MTPDSDDRILRGRRLDRATFADQLDRDLPAGVHRQLVRVIDGGSFPAAAARVFMTVAVSIDCEESEGATPTYVDGSVVFPVVFVGVATPSIGGLYVVTAIGGRWLAEVNSNPPTTVPCSPCAIPKGSLTVSWVNGMTGGGSAMLTWDGSATWSSGCVGPLRMTLACVGGSIVFTVGYYAAADCPGGASVTCTSAIGLTLVASYCTPFVLTYSCTFGSCPAIASRGYTQFTITM